MPNALAPLIMALAIGLAVVGRKRVDWAPLAFVFIVLSEILGSDIGKKILLIFSCAIVNELTI